MLVILNKLITLNKVEKLLVSLRGQQQCTWHQDNIISLLFHIRIRDGSKWFQQNKRHQEDHFMIS
jgi:hypothetical protein